MRLSVADLARANRALLAKRPLEILAWAHEAFGARAAILTSTQRAGAALCHMADRAGLGFDVLFVDTGVLHAETLAARDRLAETHPNLRLRTLRPAQSFAAQTRERGLLYVSKEGQERCCDLRKSAPLRAERGRYDALVAALRRDEGGKRASVAPLALDEEMGCLRVHPFAVFERADLDAYIAAHVDVIVNELHAMGFPTVGCFPCTTPVRPDEPERAGRWRHLADVAYCGINPTDRGEEASIDASQAVIAAIDALARVA